MGIIKKAYRRVSPISTRNFSNESAIVRRQLDNNSEAIKAVNAKVDSIKDAERHFEEKIDGIARSINDERQHISAEYLLKAIEHSSDKSNRKKILVCGYYGARNYGDELMLNAVLDKIDQKKYDVTIMLAANPNLDVTAYCPYDTIHYPRKVDDCMFVAKHFDAIIWGGGAVLDDTRYHFDNYPDLTYCEMTISKAMIKMGKRVIVEGVSANREIADRRFIDDLSFIIKNATHFSLRDTNSLKTLEKAGIDTSNIDIVDDLALLNKYTVQPTTSSNLRVAISLMMNHEGKDNYEYDKSFIEKIIKHCSSVAKAKTEITFIPFFDFCDNDVAQYERIINDLKIPKNTSITIAKNNFSVADISELYNNSDLIVSMRYHGVLLSSVIFGKNTLCINYGNNHRHYENKIQYIKQHYFPNLTIINYDDANNEDLLVAKIEEALAVKSKPYDSKKISGAKFEQAISRL